jgi:hypothetical protein
MTKEAKEISENLKTQPSWIVHDVQTFQWLRFNNPEIFDREKLGGGNILSIIGLFSVINYYSKVYKILQSGKLPKKDKEVASKTVFVEDQAFKTLVQDFEEKIVSPEQNDESLTKIWKIFRNSLSHMAQIYPGNQAVVLFNTAKIPHDILRKSIKKSEDTPFIQVGNGYICFVDKLISYTESIREWILNDMDARYKKDFVVLGNQWIKENVML